MKAPYKGQSFETLDSESGVCTVHCALCSVQCALCTPLFCIGFLLFISKFARQVIAAQKKSYCKYLYEYFETKMHTLTWIFIKFIRGKIVVITE